MRLTGGDARGRRLRGVPRTGVRPTGARVREAIFNMVGQRLDGVRVLDLFAGVGTLGIEALSRGAAHVTFVERDARAAAALRANLDEAVMATRSTVVERTAADFSARAGAAFDLVLADPPYADAADVGAIETLLVGGRLSAGARVVIEHGRRVVPPDTIGGALALLLRRRYGDTIVSIYGATRADASTGKCSG